MFNYSIWQPESARVSTPIYILNVPPYGSKQAKTCFKGIFTPFLMKEEGIGLTIFGGS